MKTRWLVLSCVLVFVYTAITRAPLGVIYGYIKPTSGAAFDLIGLEGNLQQGGAAGVIVGNQTALRDLRWTMLPLQLLIGRAAFDLSASGDGLLLAGRVAQSISGQTHIDGLTASGSIKPLLAAFKLFVPVDGTLSLDLQQMSLAQGLPTTAEGRIDLKGLQWKLARDPMPLGDFSAIVAPTDQALTATISADRGPLDASGDAHLLPDRRYELHLQVKAKADAPPPLVNMLASLGAPDNQGYYHIRRSGQLAAPAAPAAAVTDGASP